MSDFLGFVIFVTVGSFLMWLFSSPCSQHVCSRCEGSGYTPDYSEPCGKCKGSGR